MVKIRHIFAIFILIRYHDIFICQRRYGFILFRKLSALIAFDIEVWSLFEWNMSLVPMCILGFLKVVNIISELFNFEKPLTF